MTVPYQFANATTSIPLSQLDSNFNTAITIGNTGVQLGNTITTLNNMNLVNVTLTSVATTIPNSLLANSNVTIGNTVVNLGSTITTINNTTLVNATVSSLSTPLATTYGGTGASSLASANIAQLNALETFTASQRGTVTNANTAAFDMNVTNNFSCTPSAAVTLTFSNITAGQSGFVLLNNANNYAISANAATKVSTTALATLSSNGVYLLSYFAPNSSAVYLVNSGALA